ncbi:MAG: M56 family metallopeptidase [Candidatus Sulfopaludibacter sp.]|nr:M56 family metallopeptidase [Candidatus Sulfopaludibacter sp.]
MKNRPANARYLASSAALAVLAILPVMTTWVLYRGSAPTRDAAGFVATVWPAAAALPRTAGAQFAWLGGLQAWALPLWFAGVFVFSLRLAWGCRQVSVLRRTGEPAAGAVLAMAARLRGRLRLQRAVGIVITQQTGGPSVVGWLRPVILLPAATLLGLSEQQLAAVLTHEFAHIRRHDYLVNLAQNLVETLLFYHPVVWWTSARIRHERELCCDDVAVRSCGDAIRYARALTVLEKLRGSGVSLAMGSTGGSLLFRVRRLMGLQQSETAPSRLPVIAALLLGVACLGLNMNWARAQEQGEPGIVGVLTSPDSPGVQIDIGGATVVERTGVEYPGYAWERKIGGIVVVEATLDAQGSVSDARILSGPAELRKNALQSVLEWHFAPAAAGSIRQVSINFQWEQAQKNRGQQETKLLTFNGQTVAFSVARENQTLKFLEEELEKARQNPAEPAQIAEIEKKLAIAQEASLLPREPGIIVSRIEIAGLTDLQQKQLAERMPVRIGDSLTQEQSFALAKAVGTFDPPLTLGFSNDGNHQLVIRISPDKSNQ